MKIEQIRQILEVYRVGSINKASQNLYVAQSTLSSSIHAAEEELHEKIFIRGQKGIELTEFGHIFLKHGAEILDSYEKILVVANLPENKKPKEKFSVSVYYLLFVNRIFYQLYNKYHDQRIDFCYKNDPRNRIISDVAQGVSEIGILVMPTILKRQWLDFIHSHGLEFFVLSKEQPRVLFGKRSPLSHSNQPFVTIDDLKDHSMIVIREHSELFKSMETEIIKIFHPQQCIKISDRELLTGMLLQTNGYYVSTMNQNAYKKEPYDSEIQSLPVKDATSYSYEIGLIKRQKTTLTPLAVEFINLIRTAISEDSPYD